MHPVRTNGDHRFSEGGIFVINAQSAKGLEFDSVFLADIDEYHCHLDDSVWMDEKRRLFLRHGLPRP